MKWLGERFGALWDITRGEEGNSGGRSRRAAGAGGHHFAERRKVERRQQLMTHIASVDAESALVEQVRCQSSIRRRMNVDLDSRSTLHVLTM